MHYSIKYKMNSVKEIVIKNRMHHFFDDMINIKNLDPNKIKIDQKSYKGFLFITLVM